MKNIKIVLLKFFIILYIFIVVLIGISIHDALPEYWKLVGGGSFMFFASVLGGAVFTEKLEELERRSELDEK